MHAIHDLDEGVKFEVTDMIGDLHSTMVYESLMFLRYGVLITTQTMQIECRDWTSASVRVW